jgi:signal peptidase I
MLRWLKRHVLSVATAVAFLAVLPSYVGAYSLSGGSAAPTMLMGDTIIVNRAAYDVRAPYSRATLFHTGSPRRGDIVFALLPDVPGPAFKRVIGLPGETIELRENQVFIDGRPLAVRQPDKPAVRPVSPAHRMGSTISDEDGHTVAYTPGASPFRNCQPVKLGPGQYFLMGDNRDNSLDSRAFGPVSRDKMLGKVLFVIPPHRFGHTAHA